MCVCVCVKVYKVIVATVLHALSARTFNPLFHPFQMFFLFKHYYSLTRAYAYTQTGARARIHAYTHACTHTDVF